VGINWIQQKRLLSDQYTLFRDLIFHPIWSRAHCSLAVLWRIVSSGRFIGRLARNHAPHFDGHPLASQPILMDGNARPHNPYSARLSATGGNRATTLVSHVTGYESDTHDEVNNEHNRLASCTVPENVP
jgi:hypothetical protein